MIDKDTGIDMEKITTITPTAELPSEMLKVIFNTVDQRFCKWRLNEEDDGTATLELYAEIVQ